MMQYATNVDGSDKQQQRDSDAVQWTRRLVGFDTVSHKSNLALIDLVAGHLKTIGLDVTVLPDGSGQWANILATLPAQDGSRTGGLILSGHTDVVPVDGQDWLTDPFCAEIREARIYGRGACDMKGFIGVTLALIQRLAKLPHEKPVHLAFSFDEEVGCTGIPILIEELARRGLNAEGCVVGEPTDMLPVYAHKGQSAYRCCVHGKAAHSSLTPYGVNAIEYASLLVRHVRDTADDLRRTGPFDNAFDVPYSTAQTGLISGGIATNTVPDTCELSFEFRTLPGVDPDDCFQRVREYAYQSVLPQMKEENQACNIEFSRIADVPAFEAPDEAQLTKVVRQLQQDFVPRKVAYGTEAGFFSKAQIPTLICGPGSISHAHKANEFISLEQLRSCEVFLNNLISYFCKRTSA
ncbi:acetylornithine deacetylase [Paraburkholderia sp. MM6662-R1]|uniref:acetylornithine deacetylase n=1 Tax=Paraburkholderia sp. MM6662-R1 TaxID=2991066 RepID=UPI003D253D2D